MQDNSQIINLYSELANNPSKDFGWDKGLDNAKSLGYKQEWIDVIDNSIWEFCAAVGNPFKDATIKEGDSVLDLGCGAGVDVLVSRLHVGESGKVIGVDITPKMVEKAKEHVNSLGFSNIKILESSFETIDIEDESIDVVISNGAINLTTCKESVFKEIYRVLKPNGSIYFADMIDISTSSCHSNKDDWANCVAGTMKENELIELIKKEGFKDVTCNEHTHYKTSQTTQGATFKAIKIPSNEKRHTHWDKIFQQVDYTQVLWHQNNSDLSLNLIQQYSTLEANIIDVGCGASLLVDNLLKNGYKNITLLDTSNTSLDIVKNRIPNNNISIICDDILEFKTTKKFDIWHDRAVFHFLLTKKERANYFQTLSHSLNTTRLIHSNK